MNQEELKAEIERLRDLANSNAMKLQAAQAEVDRQVGILCGVREDEMEDKLVRFPS